MLAEFLSFGQTVIAWVTANFLALGAILVAGWSAWTSHRAFKHVKGSDTPIVSATIDPVKDQAGWFNVRVTVTNRADYPISAVELAVCRPSRGRLLARNDGIEMDHYEDPRRLNPLPVEQANRKVRMRMTVGRAGSKPSPGPTSHIYGMRDCHDEDAFLYIPPASLPCPIKLRLRLASSEAVSKRMDIVIQRELRLPATVSSELSVNGC